jgi:hypothetical protein
MKPGDCTNRIIARQDDERALIYGNLPQLMWKPASSSFYSGPGVQENIGYT